MKSLIVLILILLVLGLWFFPSMTKDIVKTTGKASIDIAKETSKAALEETKEKLDENNVTIKDLIIKKV